MSDKFANANPNFKDSLFRDFFNDRVRLLSLCNALLHTNYSDINNIEINTINTTFFSGLKNDISCKIGDNFLVLVEHQSTVNENMPFRFLSYISELLNNLVQNKNFIYKQKLVTFPAPKFFVLYDGDNENEPVQRTLKLSDAFLPNSSSLELIVYSFNINLDKNAEILNLCQYLRDYSTLIAYVKLGLTTGLSRRSSIIHAINRCISENVMLDYLTKKKQEVFTMLDYQWNIEDAKQVWQDEAFEQGIESVALNLISMGLPFDKIQEATKLSIEKIHNLANTLNE